MFHGKSERGQFFSRALTLPAHPRSDPEICSPNSAIYRYVNLLSTALLSVSERREA